MAQEDYATIASTKTLWGCRQLCQKYTDCGWVSWDILGQQTKGKFICKKLGKLCECLES